MNEWMCHFCLSLIPINSLVRIWQQKDDEEKDERRKEIEKKKGKEEERKMLNPMLEWNQIIGSIKSIPIQNMNGWWVMN